MGVVTSTGSKFFIGPQAGDSVDDIAAYEALSYTEVKEVKSMGGIGDTAKIVTWESLGSGRVRKSKGARDAGTLDVPVGRDPADLGQRKLKAAEKSNRTYAFKVTAADAITAETSGEVTITIASPGVVTWANHGLVDGCQVSFKTTGALPTGLVVDTVYYVVASTAGSFKLATGPDKTPIVTTGTQNGVHTATAVGSPTSYYFRALVNAAPDVYGENDTIVTTGYQLPVDSEIIERLAV